MSESSLQQEIARIEQDLAAKRAALEQQKAAGEIQEVPHEKETLREMVGEQIQMSQPAGSLPAQPVVPAPLPADQDTPSYMTEALNAAVRGLIEIAFNKSIGEAVKSAKSTGNAALIDAFHDALVDELYDNLIEYRKLRKL